MATQLIRVFHEEQDFGLQILNASDLHFKEKECEVSNSAVINSKILSSVLPNSSGKNAGVCKIISVSGKPLHNTSIKIVSIKLLINLPLGRDSLKRKLFHAM